MYLGRHYIAISGTALFFIILLVTAVLIVGVAGRPPEFGVSELASYQPGHSGIIVVSAHNQWWGRTVYVQTIDLAIANGNRISLFAGQIQVSPQQQLAYIFNFTIPQETPTGTQSYQLYISFAQTTFYNYGQESIREQLSGPMVITA